MGRFREAVFDFLDAATGNSEAQALVERCAREMIPALQGASDEDIAQLIRDALVNRRVRDPVVFRWASAETVGRVRRTMVGEYVASLREEQLGRLRVCRACGNSTRPDAIKCIRCGAWF